MISTDYCPDCARPIEPPNRHCRAFACPHCGATVSTDVEPRWLNVARVANLAEAGFLADELAGEDIEARILQTEDFSALTDRWNTSYLIQSPPRDAQAAAARIRRYLAEMEVAPEATHPLWTHDRTTLDQLSWRPVALIVLAGMASFVLGQKLGEQREASRPPRNSLPRAVSAIGRPFVTEPAAGLPRHRLSYLWRQQAWQLETDADGDGRYEAQQRFSEAAAL